MDNIKLIIWDLDDTLWQGTLADNDEVVLNQEVLHKINFLLDKGIVHSICSKNDQKIALNQLKQFGIADLFIFPDICFENKGLRIKEIMRKAQLRAQNVLFIDDNPAVIREVRFHNPEIMTQLIHEFLKEDITHWGKEDSQRSRFEQYKILEKKEKNRTIFLEKNEHDEEMFLKDCGIEAHLISVDMHDEDIERIIELVNRSNQMNFTQSRIKYDYLFSLFELKNGINFKIHVKDKYGDYGIAGYVCIIDNMLFHFVFSCRILGMAIESRIYQWVKTQYPDIQCEFSIEKLKNSDKNLDFIKVIHKENAGETIKNSDQKILVRGPCLSNAVSFLLGNHYNVDEEIYNFFEFSNVHFLRNNLSNESDFLFQKTQNALKNNEYNIILNFLESDYYSANYLLKNRLTPVTSYYIFWKSLRSVKEENPLLGEHVEKIMLDGIRGLKKFNIDAQFSPWPRQSKIATLTLDWFGERWKKIISKLFFYFVYKNYMGYVSTSEFEENLSWYVGLFPEKTQLIFINPPEKITLPLLTDQQNACIIERTKTLNTIMRNMAKKQPNMQILEMDNILEQDDIVDSYSHLKRKGYIKLSQALLHMVKPHCH